MAKRLLLLDVHSRSNPGDFVNIWHTSMNEDLVLVPNGTQNGILVVLNEPDNGAEKLAELIEERDCFDNQPLFIIWDNRQKDTHSMCVQEYAPFDESGVRQLVAQYGSRPFTVV
jgi:hypothetical protein